MRLKSGKKIALLLSLMLAVPIFWLTSTSVVSAAATPKFKKSKVEITDVGDTYTLVINNKVKGSTYKYTTSKKSVAKVSSKGVVTSVGAGSATISCKITYPSKKTKTITCKVTVILPAEQITITNETEVNGAHIMMVDSTFDFEYALTPVKSTDKTYWYVDKGDCIQVLNSADGIVKALKPGKATLRVKAVKTSSKSLAMKSIVDDSIIIEVKGPSYEIKSADIISSSDIKVVFDSPVDKSTVIDTSGKLTSNITVGMGKDSKGVLAGDYGTLTPTLSSDGTVLTITASKAFDGIYTITFTNGIKTTTGVALNEWSTTLNYVDNTAPQYTGSVLDDTGFVNTINFSEAIDVTNLKVSNVMVLQGATANSSTTSIIGNKLNYVLSSNKKSLVLNLSGINAADYGKVFSVALSGIKDLNGNMVSTAYYTATVRTDTTQKPQAVPISATRSSYNVISVYFSRGIQAPGSLMVNNGTPVPGVVDTENNKKVNYTITDADASLTGNITVSVMNWSSYNVIPTDTSAYTPKTFTVNFTSDTTSPYLTAYDFDVATGTLTLTFTENVTLASTTGIFTASLRTLADDTQPGTNINYTKLTTSDPENIIKLKLTNMTVLGTYTFDLYAGFVTDGFKNKNLQRTLSISTTGGSSTELPGPYTITQSSTNLNEIYVEFANKVDYASAQNVNNYKITGVTVVAANVTKNANDTGATVVLTVPDDAIDLTVERPVTIKGVMGYSGSYTAITNYTTSVTLKENKKPSFSGISYESASGNILLKFTEEITGNMGVKVTLLNSGAEVPSSVTLNGSNVVIDPIGTYAAGTALRIQIISNTITDTNGNACKAMSSTYMITVTN